MSTEAPGVSFTRARQAAAATAAVGEASSQDMTGTVDAIVSAALEVADFSSHSHPSGATLQSAPDSAGPSSRNRGRRRDRRSAQGSAGSTVAGVRQKMSAEEQAEEASMQVTDIKCLFPTLPHAMFH